MVITDTGIAQTKGIVNGTACTAHSLTPEGLSAAQFETMLRAAGPGGIVTLDRPPRSINVQPKVCKKFKERLRPDSLDGAVVVIPITWANARTNDTPWVPSSLFAVQNGIGMPIRRKKKDGATTKKPTSGLMLKQHSVELAFAVTDVRTQAPIKHPRPPVFYKCPLIKRPCLLVSHKCPRIRMPLLVCSSSCKGPPSIILCSASHPTSFTRTSR